MLLINIPYALQTVFKYWRCSFVLKIVKFDWLQISWKNILSIIIKYCLFSPNFLDKINLVFINKSMITMIRALTKTSLYNFYILSCPAFFLFAMILLVILLLPLILLRENLYKKIKTCIKWFKCRYFLWFLILRLLYLNLYSQSFNNNIYAMFKK